MTDALREALQELVDADDALAAHQARGYMVGDAWDFDDTQRRLSARRAEARTAARTALQEPAPVVQPDEIADLVHDIHRAVKRGKDTRDHGVIGNLKCILDHVLTTESDLLSAAPSQLVEDARAKATAECVAACRKTERKWRKVDERLMGEGCKQCVLAIRSIAKGVES